MGKSYKGNEIIEVLMRRDGMTRHEATRELQMAQRLVLEGGEDPEEVLREQFGLELDYIFDLLCI